MPHPTSLAESQNLLGYANTPRPPMIENDSDVGRVHAVPRGLTRKEFLGKGAAVALGVATGVMAIHTREANAATKAFTYDPSTIFPNPERGWFYPVPGHWQRNDTRTHNDSTYPLTESSLAKARAQGMSMVRKYYILHKWRSSNVPRSYIDEHLLYDFNLCRRAGFKLIPRFAYVWNPQDYDGTDATLYWILKHIDQLFPHLQANVDVLAHLEAGFVGYYGEWHSSKSGNVGPGARINENSRKIVRAMLDRLPKSRMMLMRYPRQIMALYPQPLSSSDAYSGSDRSRTGMNDDSFLYSVIHRGTYSTDATTRANERNYQAEVTKYVPMSGEPSGNDGSGYVFQNPIPELERMHWRFMNPNWYEAARDGVYDYWKRNGYYDQMSRRLGYRFALDGSVTYDARIRPNETFDISFGVRNYGFGTPYNLRSNELVVRHNATGREYYLDMGLGPRRWMPGTSTRAKVAGRLPSDAPKGFYKVFLSFPDTWSSLYKDGRYSIRLANKETTWESVKGYNALGLSFEVQGTPVASNSSVPVFKRRA